MDNEFSKWLDFIANFMSVIGLGGFVTWGVLFRKKSLIPFYTIRVISSLWRMSLCFLLLMVFVLPTSFVYFLFAMVFRWSHSFEPYYRFDAQDIFAYALTLILFLPFYLIGASVCLTFSTKQAKYIFGQLTLGSFKWSLIEDHEPLKLLYAIYGTENNSVDVLPVLRKMVVNNTLNIVANNRLAGDPHEGERKKMKIKLIYKGKEYDKTYNEDQELKFPEDLA